MKKSLIELRRELKRKYKYDPEAGIFTRRDGKIHANRLKEVYADKPERWNGAGKLVLTKNGFVIDNCYNGVTLSGKRYKNNRAAFLYMKGYLPEGVVVHIDQVKTNDRWDNLREVSYSCNSKNAKLSKKNKTGVKGVFYSEKEKKFVVNISGNGKNIRLGSFKALLEAAEARHKAEIEFGYPNCEMNSTALQYIKKHK